MGQMITIAADPGTSGTIEEAFMLCPPQTGGLWQIIKYCKEKSFPSHLPLPVQLFLLYISNNLSKVSTVLT